MPKVSRESAQVDDFGPVEDRHAELDGYAVSFVTFRTLRISWSYFIAFIEMSSPNHLGGVVDDRPLLLVEPDPLGQPQRDQALAEDVLHRLPEAEVDAQREGRHQLGPPEARGVGRRPLQLHAPIVVRSYHPVEGG
jgi:hypothetical protein